MALATLLVMELNCMAFKNATNFGPSVGSKNSPSNGTSSGTSSFKVTRRFDRRAMSANSIRFSRRLFCLISEARSSSSSKVLYSSSKSAAVFGPMPGTPGTLSALSPANACRSIIFSGSTPNFANTSSSP